MALFENSWRYFLIELVIKGIVNYFYMIQSKVKRRPKSGALGRETNKKVDLDHS